LNCPKCGCDKLTRNGHTGAGRQRWKCTKCPTRTTNPFQGESPSVVFPDKIPRSEKYIITAAQNATPVFEPFLQSLLKYAKHIKAELVVIPFRYRNPTSQWAESNESHEWWDESLSSYLYDGRFDLNKNLTILADIKVQPTAVSPLTGLDGITGGKSGIVGHTKLQFKTVPTPSHKLPKIMTTTGAVTVQNYSDTKAGKKGEFHHTPGACVVEKDNKVFHLRQIVACRDGSFIDLDCAVTHDGVKKAPPALGLVMGDTHRDFICPDVVRATFTDRGSIVRTLKPERLVWHDLIDFYSRNHHHTKDPFLSYIKHHNGAGDVKAEVERACAFVDKHTPKGCESIIVPSNHPEAMSRWLKETDWRQDPENAEFYLETALAVVRSSRMGPGGGEYVDPFTYWARKLIKTSAKFLDRDDSYSLAGIELGLHGDQGQNGSRGNIKGFSNIGTKSTVGHSHSPGIEGGCHQTGTSTRLRLEYNTGASSWLNTHDVIYANGKRSLLTIVDGDWRL
jgi:hypothetical protein